jgi:hypothetical protein
MSTSVPTPADPEFYRAFAERVRETVTGEHTRTADTATTRRSVDSYLRREFPALFPTEPETPAARTWTITTTNGVSVSGHLPKWAQSDPSEQNVPADRLELRLDDLRHCRYFDGQRVEVDLQERDGRYKGPTAILCPQMDVEPFADDPAERIPTVTIEIIEGSDNWIPRLDEDGVADVAAKLRAQADRLDQVAADLAAARADWQRNGGAA